MKTYLNGRMKHLQEQNSSMEYAFVTGSRKFTVFLRGMYFSL